MTLERRSAQPGPAAAERTGQASIVSGVAAPESLTDGDRFAMRYAELFSQPGPAAAAPEVAVVASSEAAVPETDSQRFWRRLGEANGVPPGAYEALLEFAGALDIDGPQDPED